MSERTKFFDDLAGVAGGAISALAGAKDEISAMVRARVDEAVRRLNLVKRDEFEAMVELASRARDQADTLGVHLASLEARIAALETVQMAPPANVPNSPGADPQL